RGLRAFVEANAGGKEISWPPRVLDTQGLTLVALYYNPELAVARAELAAAEAAVITAGARPNPSLDAEVGYNTSPESHSLFNAIPKFTIETAGKRGYRILRAQKEAEAARLGLAETAWRVRSRVRAALYDHLLALRRRDLLRAQEGIRSEIVQIFDK